MRTIAASEFKAKCLAILDEVSKTGEPVRILKRGRPVAELVPPVPRSAGYSQTALVGSVRLRGDVMEPVLPVQVREAEGGRGR